MLETLEHILESTRRFALDEAFALVVLGVIVAVTFNTKLSTADTHPRFTWLLILILGIFWLLYANQLPDDQPLSLFQGSILLDTKAVFFKRLILLAAILTLLHHRIFDYTIEGEFFVFLLGAVFGLFLVVMTTHLLMLFVALEFVSICSYLLVVMKKEKRNVEAGIKYLLFGATSSAIMLYGMSWLYGLTGTLDFGQAAFGSALLQSPAWVVQVVAFMTLGGLLFKLSAAPFHTWTPDIYEATPTPVVSFLSFAPKAAAVLVMVRFLADTAVNLMPVLAAVIIASLIIGNFSALWQTNVKRMLGYSGIAHAGFILVGLLVGSNTGYEAAFFYVTAYLVISMGSFMLIDLIARRTGSYELDSMRGLGQHDWLISALSAIIMMALVGFPPTVGFIAKLLVFSALWDAAQFDDTAIYTIILIFGLMNTAISMVYYLKVPYYVILKERKPKTTWAYMGYWPYVIVTIAAVAMIALFIYPETISQPIERLFK